MTTNHQQDNDSLTYLVSMGFDEALSVAALEVSQGNLEVAINYLTDEISVSILRHRPKLSSSTTASTFVVATMSQYSFEHGQSTCTCIALAIADTFLSRISSIESNPMTILTSSYLDAMLKEGVESYQAIVTSPSIHVSAEEAWTNFDHLQLQGEVFQGVLSSDLYHPLGIRKMLENCIAIMGNSWGAIVITKTPETVLLLISSRHFILVDSHPRPHLFPQAIHAYAILYDTLDELVAILLEIFPIVDLDPDVSDLMTAMYNSFDLYVFKSKELA